MIKIPFDITIVESVKKKLWNEIQLLILYLSFIGVFSSTKNWNFFAICVNVWYQHIAKISHFVVIFTYNIKKYSKMKTINFLNDFCFHTWHDEFCHHWTHSTNIAKKQRKKSFYLFFVISTIEGKLDFFYVLKKSYFLFSLLLFEMQNEKMKLKKYFHCSLNKFIYFCVEELCGWGYGKVDLFHWKLIKEIDSSLLD
jgi:hypothetical protein